MHGGRRRGLCLGTESMGRGGVEQLRLGKIGISGKKADFGGY